MKTIYIRKNKINGKQYVGQTSDFKRRERDWRKLESKYSNDELNKDRIEYGLDNFDVKILCYASDSVADEMERYYIKTYNTLTPYGYNKYTGGVKGFTFDMNEESKSKISLKNKGVTNKHSENGKKRIAEATRQRLSMSLDQIDQTTGEVLATFPSAREAARQLGLSQMNISVCCSGGFWRKGKWVNRIQYKGYLWKRHR